MIALERVVRLLMALADAFGLARSTVLSTACQQCPELRPSWEKMASKRADAANRVGINDNDDEGPSAA